MAMLCVPLLLGFLPVLAAGANFSLPASSKRGLVYIPNSDFPEDDQIWVRNGSDLTWYYNYKPYPSSVYANTSMQFVPMLWGAPYSFSDTTFLDNVTAQITQGRNITYVMGFNEPDNTADSGGSNIDPSDAARYWKRQMEPLKAKGVSLGAPAVTGGSSGFTWLASFVEACDGGCTFDFIPIHWYGSFDGLASHIADVLNVYPGKKIWITEFALDNANLNLTQEFFLTTLPYLDQNENVTHYSYFGSFRSFTSNVGINVAMLNSYGNLTDIGSWYLGGNSTGVVPDDVKVTPTHTGSTATATYTVPPLATQLSGARFLAAPGVLGLLGFGVLGMIL